jgi:hypothetical protein
MANEVEVSLSLTSQEAMALAQYVRRVVPDDCRQRAGDEAEADAMYDAFLAVSKALLEAGYAPR